jgi:Tfp pilus assembly protein PilN
MAVQFNLLPDVKLEFDRAQHAKRLVYTLSFLASAAAVGLFVISFLSVNVLQKKLLDNANNDITNYSNKLKAIPDLNKILTVQDQLGALPNLHQQKHYGSRLFTYLPEITPTKVSIGKLDLDTTANTIIITGTADTVESVNKFVDTLKFTKYAIDDSQSNQKNAFSSVLLTKIDRDDKGASYTVSADFDPALFSGATSVKLVVPQETTTRSVINAPGASPLFNGQTGTTTQQGNQ